MQSFRTMRSLGATLSRLHASRGDSNISQTAMMTSTITNALALETDYGSIRPPIQVRDLKQHVEEQSDNNYYAFSEEYQVRNWAASNAIRISFGVCVCVRERETDRQTERQRQRERESERETETETERESEKERVRLVGKDV